MSKVILKDESGRQFNLEQSDELTYKKVFNSGEVDIAHDCSETGLYKLNGVTMKDPFGPYIENPTVGVYCLVRTECFSDLYKYQEIIWDAGKFFRGTYQGNDHYWPWMTEAWHSYRIEDLEKRISALEKQIGGVLTRLYTKLRGTFTSLEVAA